MSTVGPAGEGPVLDGDEAETADPRGNPDGAAAADLPDAAPRRIAWDETGESDQAAGVVGVVGVAGVAGVAGRRRWVRPAVMVSVIVFAAVAWLVVWFGPGAAGPADRD